MPRRSPLDYTQFAVQVFVCATGYRHGYTVAAAFLYWLEQNKRPEIVRELNTAMKTRQYHPKLWKKLAGASLDALWKQFLKASASN